MNKNIPWPPNVTHKAKIKDYIESVYKAELNGVALPHTDLIKIFIRFMENSIDKNLIATGILTPKDFRNAMFNRIEIPLVNYFHSINQSLEYHIKIISDTVELGYTSNFGLLLAGGEREVQLRTAFLDSYFYNIDNFIQNMNREFDFGSSTNTKRKQQVFTEMLKHFNLEEAYFTPKKIFDLIFKECKPENLEFIEQLRDNSDRKIKYADIYEYVANMRNSLHNNGFSNKTMNNLAIGHVKFEMKAGKFMRCLSLMHLLTLLIPLTKILEILVEKSIEKKSSPLADPFRLEVQSFLAEDKSPL